MTDYRRATYQDGSYIWQPGMAQAEVEAIIAEVKRSKDSAAPWWKRITG